MSSCVACNTQLCHFLFFILLELVSAFAALTLYNKGTLDQQKIEVVKRLAQDNPAAYIPALHSVPGAGRNFFCTGCQRLDVEARRIRTSEGAEVTVCSNCFDGDNICPMWESNKDNYVGVPTDEEKHAGTTYETNPYTIPILERFIHEKLTSGLSYEDLVKRLEKVCPLLVGKWSKSRISNIWNNGGCGIIHLSQLTRDCEGVAIKTILETDAKGGLTNRIKREFRDDNGGIFSKGFLDDVVFSGRRQRGGGSTNRRSNAALRILYPELSVEGNWVQPKALKRLAGMSKYKHIVGKTAKLRKILSLVAIFELLFEKASCVLKAWSPDGLDLDSVDWSDSTSVSLDVMCEWVAIVCKRLSLCCGRDPIFLDLSGSKTSAERAAENRRVEDAIASEIMADQSRIIGEMKSRKDKVRQIVI